ncbi:reverse transcriptase domain-containing protein, partial [Serratia sp. BIGb0163]|uniref:reverse transcriptase domain-containing protein n=1 Tax=Serratia sp. BIGb0163 TaxID=2940613 RepID=UPI00216974C7
QAWQWLCEQRTAAPDNADVWHIRWAHLNTGEGWLTALTDRLLRGDYRLTPLQLQGQNESRKAVWGAQDALVLKWVALCLQHQLPLHPSCEHVTGHGGGKQSIETLHHLLTDNTDAHEKKTDDSNARGYTWVCRTDIRGYYRNINKQTLINQVNQHVTSPALRGLVHQYIHYTVEDGGTFHTPEQGISRGCPLSPLMGALHLYDMDEHFSQQPNIHYARYMDDVIILAKTRWQLRKHTKRLMQWFGEYGFEAHPDKTQIGRTEKGFDWMGAWLTSDGVTDIAPRAKANHREKVRRLYEQLARVPMWKRKRAAPQVHARVSIYRKRWTIWAGALIGLAS